MGAYNPLIHYRKSIRLQGYDYSKEGFYFITICCKNREHFFGSIENSIVVLNAGGEIAFQCWRTTPTPKINQYQKIIPRSVGSIVRGFKIGVTKWFRTNTEIQVVWQRNFHERIIYRHESYQRISRYIRNNPSKWMFDQFNK